MPELKSTWTSLYMSCTSNRQDESLVWNFQKAAYCILGGEGQNGNTHLLSNVSDDSKLQARP